MALSVTPDLPALPSRSLEERGNLPAVATIYFVRAGETIDAHGAPETWRRTRGDRNGKA